MNGKITFIVGAGASKHAGAPLAKEFLKCIERNAYSKNLGKLKPDYDTVLERIFDIRQAAYYFDADYDNIEFLYSIIDLLSVKENAPELKNSFVRVLSHTLHSEYQFYLNGRAIKSSSAYSDLIGLIKRTNLKDYVGFITFNYDLGIDSALHDFKFSPDYGIEQKGDIPLYKLHGSLNFYVCKKGHFVINNWEGYLYDRYFPDGGCTVNLSRAEFKCGNCSPIDPYEPAITLPGTNKSISTQFQSVWRNAMLLLQDTEVLVLIGYSIPETDYFFRYLLAAGLLDGKRVQQIIFWNSDKQAYDRMRALLNPSAREKLMALTSASNASLITPRGGDDVLQQFDNSGVMAFEGLMKAIIK